MTTSTPSSPMIQSPPAGRTSQTTIYEDFLLGATAAAIAKTAFAPMERLILLLHYKHEIDSAWSSKSYSQLLTLGRRFWQGNLNNLIFRYAPTQGANFMFKESYKQFLINLSSNSSATHWSERLVQNVSVGSAAGATSLLLLYPATMAKGRGSSNLSLSGAYKGFGIVCIGTIIYRGIYFGGYDTLVESEFMRDRGFLAKFGLGSTVAFTAGVVSYPFDTIRRRMTMSAGSKTDTTPSPYRNSFDCVRQILVKEGLQSFYSGAVRYSLTGGLTGGLVLALFDYGRQFYLNL